VGALIALIGLIIAIGMAMSVLVPLIP